MQNEIGSYDAKTKLPELLRRVQAGESFTITNRGKPVAEIIPSRINDKQKKQQAIKNILNAKRPLVSDHSVQQAKESRRR